jgi:hypothetical protein
MSGETARSESSWTVDTLKDHLTSLITETEKRLTAADESAQKANQQRFDSQQQGVKDALTAQKEAVAAALVAAEKAVLVAETNAEKWRMNANEWRGSMLDRETKFAMRTEVEAELKGIRTEIAGLRETRAEGIGGKGMILFLIAILGAAATIVGVVIATKG